LLLQPAQFVAYYGNPVAFNLFFYASTHLSYGKLSITFQLYVVSIIDKTIHYRIQNKSDQVQNIVRYYDPNGKINVKMAYIIVPKESFGYF